MLKTHVDAEEHAWFALADAEHCRLLRCHTTKHGTRHVDEYAILNHAPSEREHARPMTGGGMTHNIEEDERRFGYQVVEWLRGKVADHAIDQLVIFAPPRILGVLRKASASLLNGHLVELKGDLMRLDAGALAEHAMIRKLDLNTRRDS